MKLIFLIVFLTSSPQIPGVVVGVYESEFDCWEAAFEQGVVKWPGISRGKPGWGWRCEVRT